MTMMMLTIMTMIDMIHHHHHHLDDGGLLGEGLQQESLGVRLGRARRKRHR
jgi:hypothetical protein